MDTAIPSNATSLSPGQRQLKTFYRETHYKGGDHPTVLSGAVLDSIARVVLRVKEPNSVSSLLAALVLSGLLAVVHAGIQLVLAPGTPVLPLSIMMLCGIGGWAALTAQSGTILGFPPIADNLPQILDDTEEATAIVNWSVKVFGLRRQFVFSITWSALIFGLTYALFPLTSASLRQESRLAFGTSHALMNFFGGNMLYWALHYPSLWRQIGDARLNLNRFNPSSTVELRAMGMVANIYVLVASIILTGYMVWLNFIAAPAEGPAANYVSLGMTAIILVGSTKM